MLETKLGGLETYFTGNVIMFSGGKDSTYLLKYCLDNKIPYDAILFVDTGLELPLVYEWVVEVEQRLGVEIIKSQAKKTFYDLFYTEFTKGKHKGKIRGFPFELQKWCWIGRDLKFRPSDRLFPKATRLIGYCADEPQRTAHLETETKAYKAPLAEAGLTQKQVLRLCKKEGLYPPIYDLLKKYRAKKPRTGCWMCPKANLAWCRLLYFLYPDLWNELQRLEKDSPHGWKHSTTTEKLAKRFKREALTKELDEWC